MTSPAKARIRALLDKTVERGCTEAEAVAAAQKAAQLMRDHGLSPEDVVIDTAEAGVRTRGRGVRDRLWSVIGHFTNAAPLIVDTKDGPVVSYTGRAPGPDVAAYLTTVCNRAIDRELVRFKAGEWYRRRRTARSRRQSATEFVDAMVARLTIQIEILFRGQHDPAAMAEAYAARKSNAGGPIVTVKPKEVRHRPSSQAAYHGWAAGEIELSHAVNGGTPAALPSGDGTS